MRAGGHCFSPLHEGDTSVADISGTGPGAVSNVSVPFTRGTPPWQVVGGSEHRLFTGFSPLHEGDTSVAAMVIGGITLALTVSVPFTRGTPPWLEFLASEARVRNVFQSPSRGGHLRG